MNVLTAILLTALAGDPRPSHPPQVQVYLECPDVPALVRAYAESPLAALLADPTLGKLLPEAGGEERASPTLARLVLPALVTSAELDVDEALSVLSALTDASLSIRGLEFGSADKIGVQLVLAFASDETAERGAKWLDVLLAPVPAEVEATNSSPPAAGDDHEPAVVLRSIALPMQGTRAWPLWQSRRGREVVIGYGSSTAEAWRDRLRSATAGTEPRDRWAPAAEWTASSGATVLRAEFAIDTPPSMLPPAVPLSLVEQGALALAPVLGSRGTWRVELRGDRFVTEGVTVRSRPASADEAWCCRRPLPATAAKLVPSTAVGAWITSVHPERIEAWLRAALVLPAGSTDSATEHALPSLAAGLGSSAALCLMPLVNLQRLIPPLMLELEVTDARAFEAAWSQWSEGWLRARPEWSMQKKPYRDVPLYIFRSPGADARAAAIGPFQLGTVQPTIALLSDRLLIALGPGDVRAEIARLEKSPGELHAIASARFPEDAIDGGTIDWAGAFRRLYDAARGLLPLLAQNAGSLPFDPAALPPASSWTRHFRPSIGWTRGDGERHVHYGESSFGPETPLALAAFASSLARSFETPPARTAITPPSSGGGTERADPKAEIVATEKSLRDLAVGLTVYRNVHGGLCPAEIEELVRPASGFPRGFLDTESVPEDGWGRPFSYTRAEDGRNYRLWSFGADGVDQSGAGDDVRLP